MMSIILTVFLLNQSTIAEEITPAPAFTGQHMTEFPLDNWITNGGDSYNRRFSPLTQINKDNVKEVKAIWRTHLDGSGIGPKYSGEASPIVYAGVIYVITGADDVFAVSVETGDILWKYLAELDETIDAICCGWTSRGVGLGEGKIFVGQLDGKLVALDQKTGDIIWSVQAEDPDKGYTITSAPLYYDGMVITGFAGAEYATRGRVKAYAADSGEHIWTFYTIPGPGQFGHDTWPSDNNIWKHGGASVWQTPAVDPDLDLLYFSTGNPGPDLNGAVREGDNLFSNAIVAIEAKTGKYRWHFQQVHHGIWDFDAANPVILFDAEINGQMRKGLVEVGKTGWAYILDRETGEPLIGINEQPMMQEPRQLTSPTQPIPVGDPIGPLTLEVAPEGFELINNGFIFTPFWDKSVAAKRTEANWPPSSFNPQTNTLYICASERIFFYNVDEDLETPAEGDLYFGGTFGPTPFSGYGLVTALHITTNTVKWNQRWPDRCYSGMTTTASGLLFVGRNDGRMVAMDAGNGKKLWEFRTDAGLNAPINTFEYQGKQYLVALSAGNLFARSEKGDSLWLMGLDGTIDEPVKPEAPLMTNLDLMKESQARDSHAIYNQACQFCHGPLGEGGHNGIPLITTQLSAQEIHAVIRDGRNQMPGFMNILTAGELQELAEYVMGLKQ